MTAEQTDIREISYGSSDYRKSLDLRNRVLRKPLGLNLFDENLERESEDIHIGAFDRDILVGILILTRKGGDLIQMRQVAVDEACRGRGTGGRMVAYSERLAKSKGCSAIILHARETAVEFYQKLGYRVTSDLFREVGIPHREMKKEL